jgi:transposase
MRYELSEYEWAAIKPFLPNKPRGVPRVNDRRVLNGIFWVLRSGAPSRDLPDNFGPYTTCYNRFAAAGVTQRPEKRCPFSVINFRSRFAERSQRAGGTGPFPSPLAPFESEGGPFSRYWPKWATSDLKRGHCVSLCPRS